MIHQTTMDIYLITTLFVYAVLLYTWGSKVGDTSYYVPQKVGVMSPVHSFHSDFCSVVVIH